MLKYIKKPTLITLLAGLSPFNIAQDNTIELETTIIKGNTELPKVLYVVPWQDVTKEQSGEQKLTLHSLFGDLFEPVTPNPPYSFGTSEKTNR